MTLAPYMGYLLTPGMGSEQYCLEHDISGLVYGSIHHQTLLPYALVDGSSTDTGNTSNTTVLRIGLVMAYNTSAKKWQPFESAGSNGIGSPGGILLELGLNTQLNGASTDRWLATIMVMGCVYPTGVCIKSTAGYGIDKSTTAHVNVRKGFKYNIRFADDFGSYVTDPMGSR